MSDISQVEERLFLLLDAVEKLTEETKEIQATVITQQALIEQQRETLDAKLNSFAVDQEHFDKVVQNTVYYAVVQNIGQGVFKEVKTAVNNATAQSLQGLVKSINDAAKKVDDNKKLISDVQLVSLDKSKSIRDEIIRQEKTLVTKHYKLVTMFGGGMFLLMFLVIFIFYHSFMPSNDEIRERRKELDSIKVEYQRLSNAVVGVNRANQTLGR